MKSTNASVYNCPRLIAVLSRQLITFVAIVLTAACSPKQITPQQVLSASPPYNYPINNPYVATVVGVPPEMKVDYSALPQPELKTITLFKDRPIPEGFWYQDGFKYSQLLQSKPAPVVYVIGGTGADSRSDTMRLITNILYSSGFSVVLVPSPTNPNFIINASRNYIAGNPVQDARDIYGVMKVIDGKVTSEASVTGRMLIGYSLGALDAAYTAKLDDNEHVLNFSKVLLVNPPYSLYSSMQVIDNLLYSALPGGINDAGHFVKTAIARLSSVSQSTDALNFQNERLLLDAYQKYKPSDNRLATTIGLSFRLAAADMIFTADVMSHSGYIFPKNQEFTTSTSLNHYLGVALRTSFKNYFDDIYTEKYQAENPGLTKQALIDEGGLQSLAGYLSSHPKIGLMTNQDDVILAPGELDKLVALFGRNATVYPNGGHIGNLGMPAVAYHINAFLRQP
jgi:pimeloyl-ACP methyl ester carboxylesterase